MKPENTMKGLTFFPIPDFDSVSSVFGADERDFFNRRDLPDVPKEYERMAADLFYKGGRLPEFPERIDKAKAKKALMAWLGSFAPAHESKMATVGYALWLWSTPDD